MKAAKTTLLTPKQQAFVAEYLIDLNATQAAIRAGYTARNADVTGPRLLGNVGIAEAIAKATARRAERTEIDSDWVLAEAVENVKNAKIEKQYAVVKSTLELIANHTGGFTQKLEHKVTHLTRAEAIAELKGLMREARSLPPLQVC